MVTTRTSNVDDENKRETTPPAVDLPHHKLGHNCLWVLCDMRAAVVIFDVIMILVLLSGAVAPLKLLLQHEVDDDDSNNNQFASHVFLTCIAILTHGLSIVGALQYQVWPLVVNMGYLTLGHVYAMLLGMRSNHVFDYPVVPSFQLYVIPTIGIVLGLYPHAVLAYQIHSGIMTPERYHRYERQSCGCCYSCGVCTVGVPASFAV